ncbi:SGNH/GDSL hydrolase family protein [Micromonospora sp. NPDC005806]|uniref:SGNH/GDSL hydrolase family protein n=1 Tax=Micromonospora sp. NPDC005806 TaxID=3364234 RepID=UPI0036C632BF
MARPRVTRAARAVGLAASGTALILTVASPLGPATATGSPTSTVVALGDSVPAGAACGCIPFPDLYARMITPATTSVNLALGGSTSADLDGQLRSSAARHALRQVDAVLIMSGANDMVPLVEDRSGEAAYRATAEQVGENVAAAVAALRDLHGGPLPVLVLVLGYWNVSRDGQAARDSTDPDGLAEADAATAYVNDALRAAARRSGAIYVATYPAFRGPTGEADPTDLLADDGDHPNARGHELIARAAYASSERALRAAPR